MCWDWEYYTLAPGALAWTLLSVAALFAPFKSGSRFGRATAIGALAAGVLSFLVAAGLSVSCYGHGTYGLLSADPLVERREARNKLHLGSIMGALPALGASAVLALSLFRWRRPKA